MTAFSNYFDTIDASRAIGMLSDIQPHAKAHNNTFFLL